MGERRHYMFHEYTEMELLLGEKMVEELSRMKVAIFGLGSAGSYVAEALARCGIGTLILVDGALVSVSEINRQLTALHSTLGKPKTAVMKERILDIDPNIVVHTYESYFGPDTQALFDFKSYDYVVDTMGQLESKLFLIEQAKAADAEIISCMDIESKLDPSRFEIADIFRTGVCPTAKIMKRELKQRKIRKLKVLYSKEVPLISEDPDEEQEECFRPLPGSISFVSGAAGMLIAGEVVRDMIQKIDKKQRKQEVRRIKNNLGQGKKH